MAKTEAHKWEFRARFRRHAFGWKSQPAIKRVKEAVSEIKKVARKDQVVAAEGAVLFLEKVSPALERVDSSSGAIGTAVNNALAAFVDLIAAAPADDNTRDQWLERLFEAHAQDQMPYIEGLADGPLRRTETSVQRVEHRHRGCIFQVPQAMRFSLFECANGD